MTVCLGIDLSNTATGLVVTQDVVKAPSLLHEQLIKPKKLKGHERQAHIGGEIIEVLNKFRPHTVVIENYGFRFRSSTIPTVELGGLIRYLLHQYEYHYYLPSPKEVKQFATGNGNADKDAMVSSVFLNWNYETKSHDLADAFALSCMGLAHSNSIKMTPLQRTIVGAMKLA
jgi:Holliday junction resolvasome RuvABC endonuclease subunit